MLLDNIFLFNANFCSTARIPCVVQLLEFIYFANIHNDTYFLNCYCFLFTNSWNPKCSSIHVSFTIGYQQVPATEQSGNVMNKSGMTQKLTTAKDSADAKFSSYKHVTSRERPMSAPYLRLKNSKRTSKCQVFSSTVPA